MQAFRHWSGTRVMLLAAVWVIGVPLALALVAAVQISRGLHAYAPESRVMLPPQMSDVVIGVSGPQFLVFAALVVVPPLLLVVAWVLVRARDDGDRSAPT